MITLLSTYILNVPTLLFLSFSNMASDEWVVSLVPEGGTNAFHTLNDPGEDFRRTFARSTNGKLPLSMKVKLIEAHHGQMVHEGKSYQASLLVFEIMFQSRIHDRRYVSADITLEFFDVGADRTKRGGPEVVDLAPNRAHWLHKTSYDRTSNRGISLSGKAGFDLAGLDANVHWDVEETKTVKSKAILTGLSDRSPNKEGGENAVRWSMRENDGEADGIPSFLQTAVLLKREHHEPFYAVLSIKSTVDFKSAASRVKNQALRVATDEDTAIDPVTFRPRELQVQHASSTGIKAGDLKHMEKLPIGKYFRVNLSEQDPLTGLEDMGETTSTGTVVENENGPGALTLIAAAAKAVKLAAAAVTKATEAATAAAEAAAAIAEAAEIATAVAQTRVR